MPEDRVFETVIDMMDDVANCLNDERRIQV